MSKFKEIAGNPFVIGGGVVAAILLMIDFGGGEDINMDRAPAATSKAKSAKSFFNLLDSDDSEEIVEEIVYEKQKDKQASNRNTASSSRAGSRSGIDSSLYPEDTSPSYGNIGGDDYGDNPNVSVVDPKKDTPVIDPNNPPPPNCVTDPSDPLCNRSYTPGGGPQPPSSTPTVCDTSDPLSECYEEADTCVPNLVITPSQGTYISNPTLALVSAHSCVSTMSFCVQKGGGCCDPISSGSSYSIPFLISNQAPGTQDNGSYCVSFVARGSNGKFSALYEYSYVVDDSTPDINATFSSVTRIQSSEAYDFISIDSANFGQPGFSASVLNSYIDDPAAKACDVIYTDSPPATNAMRSPASTISVDTEPLVSGTDTVDFYKFFHNVMDYGDNFLTAFITYTDPNGDMIHQCQQAPAAVEVYDFPVFHTAAVSYDYALPNANGVSTFQADFMPFGHFETSQTSGSGRSNAGNVADCGTGTPGSCYMETGFINVIN